MRLLGYSLLLAALCWPVAAQGVAVQPDVSPRRAEAIIADFVGSGDLTGLAEYTQRVVDAAREKQIIIDRSVVMVNRLGDQLVAHQNQIRYRLEELRIIHEQLTLDLAAERREREKLKATGTRSRRLWIAARVAVLGLSAAGGVYNLIR